MTTSEATPAPWEIWHARFNFEDQGYKFRPVLVLARTQDGILGSIRPIRARMAGDLTTHRRSEDPHDRTDQGRCHSCLRTLGHQPVGCD